MAEADGRGAGQHLAELEKEVEASFAQLCRRVRLDFTLHTPRPPERVFKLSADVKDCRWRIERNSELVRAVEQDRAELQRLADEVERLRVEAGDAEPKFAERFAQLASRFDRDELVSTALEGGMPSFGCESSSPSWLAKHILTNSDVLTRVRSGAANDIKDADFEDSVRIYGGHGNRDRGNRVLSLLDELEAAARGIDRGRLAAAAKLEVASERLADAIKRISPKYGSENWREWGKSLAKNAANLEAEEDGLVRACVSAYVDAQSYEDDEGEPDKFEYRAYRDARHRLELARLEHRIARLERRAASPGR